MQVEAKEIWIPDFSSKYAFLKWKRLDFWVPSKSDFFGHFLVIS